ncbi:hypothetical protein DPMN_031629 [Dreissena polymorpha]|uniref:Uncharacterized protein n=2 Tax=Dreissena polymorpha TaxID=45954 RepID=A0A9D4F1J9_DREPO|nr:hypothetical protein DPMN_051424 [Dreissena polymorpha]KAH3790137.1 hypothetical protein DPMN_168332 [Dreissena polymorpha]KAH3868479.1 hypothetical protein DPMN_031629 [Dreissena polymorpha]
MNKRQHSSTASELTDNSSLDSSIFESLKGQKSKKDLEIIECNIFDQTKEIESLHCQITSKDKELQDLKTKLNDSEKRTAEILNEHEQYSRRNHLRITGLQGDEQFQSSIALT